MGFTFHTVSVIKPTILNGAALSDVVNMSDYAMGSIILPAAWTAASISFKVCDSPGGTFVPLKVAAGTVCEITVAAAGAYPLPAELLSSAFFKVWSETGSSDVAQGADRILTLMLKS